jgi:hypothetical protein
LALIVLVGCTGTDTGNPFMQPVTVDARSSDTAVSIGADTGGTTITEAWLSGAEMKLTTCEDDEFSADAPLVMSDHAKDDLLTFAMQVDEAEYCSVTIPLAASAEVPGRPELTGHSLWLEGKLIDDTVFRIASKNVTSISLSGTFDLAADDPALFLAFDLAAFIFEVDIASGVADGDGVIVIDENNNNALLTLFEANVVGTAGFLLARDENGDNTYDENDTLLAF